MLPSSIKGGYTMLMKLTVDKRPVSRRMLLVEQHWSWLHSLVRLRLEKHRPGEPVLEPTKHDPVKRRMHFSIAPGLNTKLVSVHRPWNIIKNMSAVIITPK